MSEPTKSATAPPRDAEGDPPAGDDAEGAVARIESMADLAPDVARAAFASGRTVELTRDLSGADALTIRGPRGPIELTVRFTPEGPVLRFAAAEIELASSGPMRIAAESLSVETRGDIGLVAGGDLRQSVLGDQRVEVGGAVQTEAHSVDIRARRGDVTLAANDDVRIDGERVLLNS